MTQGIVDIRGKSYRTVAYRVNEFRGKCPAADGWAIITELIESSKDRVVMKATIVNPMDHGISVGIGYAEEIRESSNINRTSAMENCETSARGRALAAIGLGGEEYASADEVLRAIEQQGELTEESPIRTQDDSAEESERGNPKATVGDDSQDWIDKIRVGIQEAIELIGEKKYKVWHDLLLSNFFDGVDSIESLSLKDLRRYYDYQQIKIKEHKE